MPWFALVAALGVGLLLVERGPVVRLPAIALTLVGVVPLAADQGPSLASSIHLHASRGERPDKRGVSHGGSPTWTPSEEHERR